MNPHGMMSRDNVCSFPVRMIFLTMDRTHPIVFVLSTDEFMSDENEVLQECHRFDIICPFRHPTRGRQGKGRTYLFLFDFVFLFEKRLGNNIPQALRALFRWDGKTWEGTKARKEKETTRQAESHRSECILRMASGVVAIKLFHRSGDGSHIFFFNVSMTPRGIEPRIFGSVDRRLIHWAMEPRA